MAACDIATLLSDACDNDFMGLAHNEFASRAIILQLMSQAAGGTETEDELYSQACENGFTKVAQDEVQFRTVLLQLFCNIGA